jgi:hypothetical protein
MKRIAVLTLLLAASLCAADVNGKWKGTAEGPNGKIERTFTFKVDGSKLTGETESEMLGKATINDGKIEGDNLSFSITANFQGNEMKLQYKGKVSGDEIKLTVEFPGSDQKVEYTLKKI